jgi:hypothetical protein
MYIFKHQILIRVRHRFFSPPKAPPISAPEVPMFTFASAI